MSKTKAIIGVCLIFFFGIVTGVAVSMRFVDRRIHDLVEGGPDALSEIVVRRLDHQLELTPEQRRKLQEIVESSRAKVRDIRMKVRPQVVQIMDGSAAQIRTILTPEQAVKFDGIVKEGRERWAFRDPPPPPPRGGPPGDEPPPPRRGPAGDGPPPPAPLDLTK